MKMKVSPFASAIAAAVAIIPFPSEVLAQGAALEEIIVTASRREQSMQQVPIAVTGLTSDDLIVRGVGTLGDIKPGAIPSVQFTKFAGGPSIMLISVRGISDADGSQGTSEQPVPVYIDGVYTGRAQGLGLDLIEPERIEVLRGPQGQLFGRNAQGGAVQFVSRKPSGEFAVKASGSFGNYDAQNYKVSLDLPEFAGFKVNFSALNHKHDAYTKQTSNPQQYFNVLSAPTIGPQTYVPPRPNKGYGMLDSEGYRVAVSWASEDERFTADYSYDDSESQDTQAYVGWVPAALPAAARFAPPPSTGFHDETWNNTWHAPFDSEASGHTLQLAWQMSDAITLKSISSYRETSRVGGATLGASLPAGLSNTGLFYSSSFEDLDQDQTSQEFQMLASWNQFDLTAGAIYYEENVDDGRLSQITGPGLAGNVVFATNPAAVACNARGLDPCGFLLNHQEAKTESYGLYAQGSYRPLAFDNRLEVTLGLRYSDDTKDAFRDYEGSTFVDSSVFKEANFSEERVDPAISIGYQWTDDVRTYARYATGYRAGGANVRSSLFTAYGAEELESWELGLKSMLAGGRVQANVAVYHQVAEGRQYTVQEAPATNPGLTNTVNSGDDYTVNGLEVELKWAATDKLQLGLNYAYMDRDDFVDVDNPYTPQVDLSRYYNYRVPEHSAYVYLDFEQPVTVGSLRFHTSYSWSDKFAFNPIPQALSTLSPDFDAFIFQSNYLDARLTWSDIPAGDGFIDIALWGKNLTEHEDNGTFGFTGCAFGGGYCKMFDNPRTYGLEVTYRYNR